MTGDRTEEHHEISVGGEPKVSVVGKAVWINVSLMGAIFLLGVTVTYGGATFKNSMELRMASFERVVADGNTALDKVGAKIDKMDGTIAALGISMAHLDSTNGDVKRRVEVLEAELNRHREEDRKIWDAIRAVTK